MLLRLTKSELVTLSLVIIFGVSCLTIICLNTYVHSRMKAVGDRALARHEHVVESVLRDECRANFVRGAEINFAYVTWKQRAIIRHSENN